MIASLIAVLAKHGLVTQVGDRGVTGWRLNAGSLALFPGEGQKGAPDPVRRSFEAEEAPRVVPFFRDLYREDAATLRGLHAQEHTAQVPRPGPGGPGDRRSVTGTLPLLFCSPTMELGVDISSLNAVAMRNVPPTPANYAQRSGRAGRSGQQAIVVTYCSSGNAHDTYYFNRSNLMVAGQVQPPRLDLANADLVRSHVHAVWLAEVLAGTQNGLGRSLSEVLDLTSAGMPVRSDLADLMADPDAARRATTTADRLLDGLASDLAGASWWSPQWSAQVMADAPASFDTACLRWRELYQLAADEKDAAHALNSDTTASPKQREEARRRYQEASRRVELLLNESDAAGQSDFYTYRYLASEGFLPGYSFPRLPLSAFIPGSRGKDSAWLQRARFLAISEFGPGALIYHEGSTYQVSRIALPRRSEGATPGQVIRSEARVCEGCGYHHPRQTGLDICENCSASLTGSWKDMLQLQQVITRPRQRISADEEERNRVGFELRTTYRFTGEHAQSRADAAVLGDDDHAILEVTYGDAAEVRVANLGRRGRANKDVHGFNLDLIKGSWLPDAPRAGEEPDDDFEANQADVQVKARVTPYVEDRRNIAVLRWVDPVDDTTTVTAQYALERGIEMTFQLEDSELASERLPDNGNRGRVLLIEAAEGGAGVLRRLATEPDALPRAALEALRICHVDPDTGAEDSDACVRGCYRCLLTYGNQSDHEKIDRRTIIAALTALAAGTTHPEQPAPAPILNPKPPTTQATTGTGAPASTGSSPRSRIDELTTLLTERHLPGPSRLDAEIDGIHLDMVFDDRRAAIVFAHPGHPPADTLSLVMAGWNIIEVPDGADLADVVDANPSVFTQALAMSVLTTAEFQIGSLVRARGREWVVLPESTPGLLVLQPLGGGVDDIAGVLPDIEHVTPASFPPPTADDLGDDRSARLLRDALRIGFRSSGGPFRCLAGIAVVPPALPARATAARPSPGHRAAPDRRRRRHRQDDRGRADRRRAPGHRERRPIGGAVPAVARRAVARRTGHQVRARGRTRPARHDHPPGAQPRVRPIGVRGPPGHDRVHRLHQGRAPTQRLPARSPRPGHHRRGPHRGLRRLRTR